MLKSSNIITYLYITITNRSDYKLFLVARGKHKFAVMETFDCFFSQNLGTANSNESRQDFVNDLIKNWIFAKKAKKLQTLCIFWFQTDYLSTLQNTIVQVS